MADLERPIIIKKVKKHKHAHHGGAWKIAYADFVTAMMAFFLLMWLISMTTPEQKEGLANYFAPASVSETMSGAGGVLGGTAMARDGNMMSGSVEEVSLSSLSSPTGSAQNTADVNSGGPDRSQGEENAETAESAESMRATEDRSFHSAAASIKQAWQSLPELTPFADNLLVEETEEGLDIQIVEQQGARMFPEGSKYPVEPTRLAISVIAPILQGLNAQVSVSGHTAAGGRFDNPRYGPWELSADRANVTRSILSEFGLSDDRVKSVIGRSMDDPFFPNDPYMAANERVRITVLHQAPPVPVGLTP
ncbi:chemotaxis protein MotB [Devosia sp. WQ 349]|uniref:flagellar motor protein MotB n=1 Tax=Devosia sp. WQ 349K1 TaxID=2800329 RepID=UPI001903E465|nr:flagellar motor protein MotB [Devosia sp. WQ 349K1]MBK1793874.1 chemotaxis protein MotB [Devosia sp. WQ 349K1]